MFDPETGRIAIRELARTHVVDGYRAKSLRCRDCVVNDRCDGAHINFIRDQGFAELQPLRDGAWAENAAAQLLRLLMALRRAALHDFTDPNAFAALYSGSESAAKAKVFAILNARYHEQEAQIIAQAGIPGAITIATNMAGRGTDIQLGGNVRFRLLSWAIDQAKAARGDVRRIRSRQ